MVSDHFIDTNIVLGATIDWDGQSKPVAIYVDELDQSTTVHTSDKVFNEALHVVYKHRQLAKRTARVVFEKFEDEFSQSRRQDLIDFVYANLADDVQENTLRGVCSFVQANYWLYHGLSQTEERTALSRTMDDIDEEFNPAKEAVETVQRGDGVIPVVEFSDTPRDYAGRYSVFDPLDRLIENTADRDILLDSWHLLQTEKLERLCFISTDRGDILSNSDAIEGVLTNVQVQHPTDDY